MKVVFSNQLLVFKFSEYRSIAVLCQLFCGMQVEAAVETSKQSLMGIISSFFFFSYF